MSANRRPLDARIVYLLDGAPLFGGVKVVLDQANLLHAAGYDVTVRCTTAPPEWMEVACSWEQVEDLGATINGAEGSNVPVVVIGTYWTTLAAAAAIDSVRQLHYCQGYEASYNHNTDDHEQVRAAYRLGLPALTVSPHLSEYLAAEYGTESRVVRQPLPSGYRPASPSQPDAGGQNKPLRVLLMSPIEIDWKGVSTGLEALRLLRDRGAEFELVRVSQWPQTPAELEFGLGGQYHCGIAPDKVQELMRGCDLLLAPSWEAEGFGLPVLEAMASGVPTLVSDVGCFRAWTNGAARLVPAQQPELWAEAIGKLLAEPSLRADYARRGLQLAHDYRPSQALASFELAIRELIGI